MRKKLTYIALTLFILILSAFLLYMIFDVRLFRLRVTDGSFWIWVSFIFTVFSLILTIVEPLRKQLFKRANGKMRQFLQSIGLMFTLFLLLGTLFFYSLITGLHTDSFDPILSAVDVVQSLSTSNTVHIKGKYEVTDEQEKDPTVADAYEEWKQPGQLRRDFYRKGELIRTLLVNKNSAVFYSYTERKNTVALVPPTFYFCIYESMKRKDTHMTYDERSGQQILTVVYEQYYKQRNIPNTYYIEKIEYYISGNEIYYYKVHYRWVDKEEEETIGIQYIEDIERNIQIDSSLFDPPF